MAIKALSTQKKVRKSYVLDTSVLVYHGESIHSFPDSDIYVPLEVLEEIDRLKTKMDLVGVNGRYVNKYLDQLREEGNLINGVSTEDGQKIFVANFSNINLLPESMEDSTDNRIISCAAELIDRGIPAIVVSRDISLRVRCDSLNIPAIHYDKNKIKRKDFFNDGIITVEISEDDMNYFYDAGTLTFAEDKDFYPKQGILLKSLTSSALALAESTHTVKKLKYASEKGFSMEGIHPRSAEQTIAAELLMDPDIHLVTMSGIAGSGKTMLAISAAMKLINSTKIYKKIILARPAQSSSASVGLLPGLLSEKLQPWLAPFLDNLELICGSKKNNYVDMLFEKGIIQMESLEYIRGRTLPNTIFIVDEAQNISHDEAKAILTRAGENCKIILIGDLEQIDSKHLDQKNSGLASVVELFKDFEHAGHIKLRKGERSKLATYATKVM